MLGDWVLAKCLVRSLELCYILIFCLLAYLIGEYLDCDKRYLILNIFRL